ncbi:MAG: 1,4-alpha-glucan branching protein GlgB [Moraxellaceae bacterium]|nr:1,4-alpha-glucan branching protein GlgB [Moraxellaceae bacterium]
MDYSSDIQPHTAPIDAGAGPTGVSRLSSLDIYLFREGNHHGLHHHLGAHARPEGGVSFAVWAPAAREVSLVGDFNGWQPVPMYPRWDSSGIWEVFDAHAQVGQCYKYRIVGADGNTVWKADPLAFAGEQAPRTASVVTRLDYDWQDGAWMHGRGARNALDAPWSIYELHLGSWRTPEGRRFFGYREMAWPLAQYLVEMGFTHVELMPLTEHPFYGSWGYQTTGYFAASSRYGSPQDLMFLIDTLHQHGIGVIMDWAPSHFPNDQHGLAHFDGTALYEHQDPRRGFHPEWNSHIFNYGRNEVRAFLISSALFWLEKYHVDALRVDAVASMLYLDYARREGEWLPNEYGGRENLDAVAFLQQLNAAAYRDHPDVQMIAEESTSWPGVSRPVHLGGLGFGMKWNMGWMHDTLNYFGRESIHRRFHHNDITFSLVYAFSENFVLPLSHDEVVYGKGSLLARQRGDRWQQFANLRAMLGYMWGHPGKKLLFMGGEFGQPEEWSHEAQLGWHLLEYIEHRGLSQWVRDLNRCYREQPALHRRDFDSSGFQWVESNDADQSVLAFLRYADNAAPVLVVCNLTPVPRPFHRLGVPYGGYWRELLNSDAVEYGGSGIGNHGGIHSQAQTWGSFQHSLSLHLPPLSTLILVAPP